MSAYYQDLYKLPATHQHAGWRDPFEQALRFEIALSCAPRGHNLGHVLDVGCGPAALIDYLNHDDVHHQHYTGVDRFAGAIEVAMRLHPAADLRLLDACDAPLPQADTVLAIGAAIDGELTPRADRVRRLRRLLDQCVGATRKQGALIALRHEALTARASLALEPALFGVSHDELVRLKARIERQFGVLTQLRWGFLQTDFALIWWHPGQAPGPEHHVPRLGSHSKVLARLDPLGEEHYRRAWLWSEAGEYSRSREELDRCDVSDARVALLRAHIAAAEADRAHSSNALRSLR